MTRYWVGTMNRVVKTEGENSLPVKPEAWEREKKNWYEVTEEEYKIEYQKAWDIACDTFWHC